MGIIEALKKGFSQTGKLMNVVLVFFVFNVVMGLVSLPFADPGRITDPGIAAISFITSLLFILAFFFIQGGALGLIKDQLKTSYSSIAQFTAYCKKFYLRILGLVLITLIIAAAVVLMLSLISAGILLLGDNIATWSIVSTIVFIVANVVITFLLYPIYAIVAEDLGVIQAFKKGIGVAKANFWRTLGLFWIMSIVQIAIYGVMLLTVGVLSVPLPLVIGQILTIFVSSGVQSYMNIVMLTAFMSFYLSLILGSGVSEQPVETAQ